MAIAWLVALGFVRLMNSWAVMQRPMGMEVAVQHLGRWLERPLGVDPAAGATPCRHPDELL